MIPITILLLSFFCCRKMNVSAYYTGLSEIHQERYTEKISLLGIDPLCG